MSMIRWWLLSHGMNLGAHLGYPLAKTVQLFRESQYWSREGIEFHQRQALSALMHHCYNHVPYYHDLMKHKGLSPDDFQSVQDLAKLPYLTRDIIRQQGARLRADNYPDRLCQFRRSGGTTGEPIEVVVDAQARAYEVAAYLRGFEWMKYRFGQPMIRLFGGSLGFAAHRNWRTKTREWLLNNHFLPAFELSPDNLLDYVAVIRRAVGGVLVGYASAIRNLAAYMTDQDIQGSPLQSVICTAEYMPQAWRSTIGEVLAAPVFCYYGCGEINSIAYECADEEGYLVSQEHIILEVANACPDQFRLEGQGQACVTALFNYAMPLIRYLNGDFVALKYVQTGRPHLRITKLDGRVVDQLFRHDGHRISGALVPHIVFRSGFPAWKYQVIQSQQDRITFHYSRPHQVQISDDAKSQLVNVFRRHLGDGLQVRFVEDEFETPRSGKHRLVINKLL